MANSKTAQFHKDASDHYKNASDNHKKAHESYSKDDHKEGSHYASNAQGSANKGRKASDQAHETHSETYGDNKSDKK